MLPRRHNVFFENALCFRPCVKPLGHLVTGVLLCVTIIGIPFGIASFKLAGLALAPFGKTVVPAGTPLPPGTRVYIAV